jgi:hypothetical protein
VKGDRLQEAQGLAKGAHADLATARASDSLTLISQVIEIRKMLYGLLRYLKSRSDDESGVPRKATKQA